MIDDEAEVDSQMRGREGSDITVVAIQDDYDWWHKNGYSPSAGKPLWMTGDDRKIQHIFFDDNIHNDIADSIVAVRHRVNCEDSFTPLSGKDTLDLQGRHLVRVPTIEPIMNCRWFLDQITKCESKF